MEERVNEGAELEKWVVSHFSFLLILLAVVEVEKPHQQAEAISFHDLYEVCIYILYYGRA